MQATQLKTQIEQAIPAAFTFYPRIERGLISTGIAQIDDAVGGIPLHALTEICGGNMGSPERPLSWGGKPGSPGRPLLPSWDGSLASSGKTSVLASLLAQATREHFCALVDAGDNFDPASGLAAGIALPRLLWVRCGKNRSGENRGKLPPLEQGFKVADILLQSGGFTLIAVDLSSIPERVVRRVPLSTWFRFSRVIERQPAALVFLTQEPHATSCASLVLRISSAPPEFSGGLLTDVFAGNLFTQQNVNVEVVRGREKKPVRSERTGFSLHTQWA